MNSQNVVILTGNLGADPERKGSEQNMVTKLLVAQNIRRFDKEKNVFETIHTNWIRVACFGKLADRTALGLKKGNRITVMGELRSSDYDSKDGGKRTSVEIIASDIVRSDFLSGVQRGDGPDFDEFQETPIGPGISL